MMFYKPISLALDPEGRSVQKPFEVLPDSTVGAKREWQVIARIKHFISSSRFSQMSF